MQITVTGKTALELRAKLMEMARVFAPENYTMTVGSTAVEVVPNLKPKENEQLSFPEELLTPAPDKKTKVKKETVKPVKSTKVDADIDQITKDAVDLIGEAKTVEAVAPPVVFTKQDALKALEILNSKKGLEMARSVLGEFGCKRLSELKEVDVEKFVGACNKAAK